MSKYDMSWNGSPNSQEQYRAPDLRLNFVLSLLSRIAILSLLPALSLARKVLLQESVCYAALSVGATVCIDRVAVATAVAGLLSRARMNADAHFRWFPAISVLFSPAGKVMYARSKHLVVADGVCARHEASQSRCG
jgi:hypothetical protein